MDATPDSGARNPDGWGLTASAGTPEEVQAVHGMLAARFGADAVWTAGPVPRTAPPTPRADVPDALQAIVGDDPGVRHLHAVGRSFGDTVALRETGVTAFPDLVAVPRDAADVAAVLDWCTEADLACIPFGGGTSVVGGVTAGGVADGRPVVTLQTRAMDRVVQVDTQSRAALVQAGATGPVLESQLRQQGLTLRFYPQSFEMATLGGWLATRAGGHFATGLVHIDDLVQSIGAETPAGRWESRRLPGSGAGPSPDRMLLGSEGILGVITDAWVRLQDRPRYKGSAVVRFDDLPTAMAALRPLVQSGLAPANCRVLDPVEALLNGAGDGSHAVMVVGAESAAVDVTHDLQVMLALLADHGGRAGPPRISGSASAPDPGRQPDGAAEAWKQSFLRAPYLRDVMVDAGMVVETFETAITHDRLQDFTSDVLAATQAAVEAVCGDGIVTCRVTHAYPDGAAPYITVIAPGRRGARVAQWAEIKAAASEALAAGGGTITHHHAVGRDHRPWYDRQRPAPFAAALAASKWAVDPRGVLNPGVLLG
ncbi:FAD-binding oxidoreductase [soil metagenome]